MKTKLAKKYIVKTDYLDWYKLQKGDILEQDGVIYIIKTKEHWIPVISITDILEYHPDWLEEVQEKEFTREDMIDFGHDFLSSHFSSSKIHNDDEFINQWIETRNNKES